MDVIFFFFTTFIMFYTDQLFLDWYLMGKMQPLGQKEIVERQNSLVLSDPEKW